MAVLLHLSDLHLGTGEADHPLGDYKLEIIPAEARQKRSDMLRATLRAISESFIERAETLDAVVISGDIAYHGSAEGYAHLPIVLDELGSVLPPRDRILVVPGNHDVAWGTPQGSPARYERFLNGVRSAGYVTPLLEGVDIDVSGRRSPGSQVPAILAADDSFVLLGLNSANNCGITINHPPELTAAIADLKGRVGDNAAQKVTAALEAQSLFDVARVDDGQRVAAAAVLKATLAKSAGRAPVVFAVMHHHLFPISLEEEVKAFESLTNLGQMRDWLALNDVDVLLHGHKHVAALYDDNYVPIAATNAQLTPHPRRLLVSSVGTVGLGQTGTGVIAKLYRTHPARPTLGRVDITDVHAQQAGVPLHLDALPRSTYLVRTHSDSETMLLGETPRHVHEQILQLAEAGPLPRPLICRVAQADPPKQIPASFRELEGLPDGDEWFGEFVDIWQQPQRLSAMPFNHGERICGGTPNQLDDAVQALFADGSTTRAVVSLLRPASDNITDKNTEFPAFCLVQLMVVDGQLRVIAYFRKQEMRYWWGVNLAELAHLQQRAVTLLKRADSKLVVESGEIITVTAMPTSGKSVPRVAVPRLDRWVDEAPDRLLRMSLVVFDPFIPPAAETLNDWRSLVADCEPPTMKAADGDPVPVGGLKALLDRFERLKSIYEPTEIADRLTAVIQRCAALNEEYRNKSRTTDTLGDLPRNMSDAHDGLKASVDQLVEMVATMIKQGRAPAPPDSASDGQD